MPLVFAAIMPHGGEIIPELADDPALMARTRSGMLSIGTAFAHENIDTVIVITPHGLIYEGHISVSCCSSASGVLDGPRGVRIGATFSIDQSLASRLLKHPTCPLLGLTVDSDDVHFPLAWGAIIPLLFNNVNNNKTSDEVILS